MCVRVAARLKLRCASQAHFGTRLARTSDRRALQVSFDVLPPSGVAVRAGIGDVQAWDNVVQLSRAAINGTFVLPWAASTHDETEICRDLTVHLGDVSINVDEGLFAAVLPKCNSAAAAPGASPAPSNTSLGFGVVDIIPNHASVAVSKLVVRVSSPACPARTLTLSAADIHAALAPHDAAGASSVLSAQLDVANVSVSSSELVTPLLLLGPIRVPFSLGLQHTMRLGGKRALRCKLASVAPVVELVHVVVAPYCLAYWAEQGLEAWSRLQEQLGEAAACTPHAGDGDRGDDIVVQAQFGCIRLAAVSDSEGDEGHTLSTPCFEVAIVLRDARVGTHTIGNSNNDVGIVVRLGTVDAFIPTAEPHARARPRVGVHFADMEAFDEMLASRCSRVLHVDRAHTHLNVALAHDAGMSMPVTFEAHSLRLNWCRTILVAVSETTSAVCGALRATTLLRDWLPQSFAAPQFAWPGSGYAVPVRVDPSTLPQRSSRWLAHTSIAKLIAGFAVKGRIVDIIAVFPVESDTLAGACRGMYLLQSVPTQRHSRCAKQTLQLGFATLFQWSALTWALWPSEVVLSTVHPLCSILTSSCPALLCFEHQAMRSLPPALLFVSHNTG